MNAKILVVFFIIIVLNTNSQAKIKVDSEFLITKNSVGKLKIGMNYSDIYKIFKNDEYRITMDMHYLKIFKNDKPIIFISNKNYNRPPLVIQLIVILSDEYKTKEGLCVGMSVDKIFTIFPESEIKLNYGEGCLESIQPKKYQSNGLFNRDLIFSICLKSYDKNFIGIYNNLNHDNIERSTNKYNNNGFVESLIIFKFN